MTEKLNHLLNNKGSKKSHGREGALRSTQKVSQMQRESGKKRLLVLTEVQVWRPRARSGVAGSGTQQVTNTRPFL